MTIKDFLVFVLIVAIIPAVTTWAILDGFGRQEKQVQENCSHLKEYAYGECAMKYYR